MAKKKSSSLKEKLDGEYRKMKKSSIRKRLKRSPNVPVTNVKHEMQESTRTMGQFQTYVWDNLSSSRTGVGREVVNDLSGLGYTEMAL